MLLSELFGDEDLALETIRKVKGGYRLVSKKTGKNLGTYPTRAGAEKRERQVQYFKHANESLNESAKVTLYTDPSYFGADVADDAGEGLKIDQIPLARLTGFEPDVKMKDPKSKSNMDKMVELIKTNKAQELPPILVRKYKDGYQVLDGHHRFHAYKAAGEKTIPGKIVPDSDIKIIDQVKEDANSDLAAALKKTKATSYDAIDALMKKIAKQHNITAKELHNLWVKEYNKTPDDWIKSKLNESEQKKWIIRNSYDFVLHRFTAPSYKEAEVIADQWVSDNIEKFGKSKKYILSKDNKTDNEKFSDLNLRLNPIDEGPMLNKVNKSASTGNKRVPLDFDKLYGRAFKITDAEGDPNKPGFSIVTPSNTNAWTDWKEKPQFKKIVKQRLNDPNFLGDHKYLQIIDAMSQISEGPIWDKVKKTAAAGAVAGAAGYGALTGQFADKDKEPARSPLEITIPGGDIEQKKPEVKKEKEKLTPSTATDANPELEQLIFLTAYRAGIKGRELAQFMAQVAHETLGFQRLVEVGDTAYFNKYDPKYNPKKAKILGNVKIGDGVRYKGRGFIQITGRDNYKRAGRALGIDLESNPKFAADPKIAAKVAVWYWNNRVKPSVNDYNDTIGVTSKVNPGMSGLGDRDMNFRHYLQRLQLED